MADETPPPVEPWPMATVEDLKARWPDFPPGADAHAGVLLEDASQFIIDVCPTAVHATASTRRRIVCAVVRRAMAAEASDMDGLSQQSLTTGPFAMSQTPANPHGDFYLTKAEKKALGQGGQKAFGVDIAGGGPACEHQPWCSQFFGARSCSCGADLTGGEPLWER
ncbi:hypothetical protein NQ036_03655 [Brevibacterium sp. 91QC2O2]|uniref:hypothetical protein n=1 Tax=Brevibacterium TaxID=1696 RepID=UPI00211BF0BA|nr:MULTISPECIES: hypothetical protein [unclassified Brevibacterium]MCQ9367342.1 hypothetical protein [Brevibacterium sp. 91QC2O2]MCQ9384645.1 hypothetical protein [Brevibacterium sp. 68QC2CO]